MAEDRSKLLRSLAIDRAAAPPPVPQRRRLWPFWLTLAVGLVALLSVGWQFEPELRALLADAPAATAEAERPPPAAEPAPVVQAPAQQSSLIASGYVVARRKATLASETTGKIVQVLVDEGMTVEAGQVVAELDSVLATKDLALARSREAEAADAVAVVEADLKDAERIYRRLQNLSLKSIASEAELTKAQARAQVLEAQLGLARTQLQTARLEAERAAEMLDKYKIRAPFAGIVTERSAQPGEMISPLSSGGFTRTGICTVVDMDSIEIEVDVNEAFIGRVRTQGEVSAVLDAYPDWTIPARVIAIVPTANREKATVKVRIGLEVKDPRILPDMAVKATFLDASAGLAAQSSQTMQAAAPQRAPAQRSDS